MKSEAAQQMSRNVKMGKAGEDHAGNLIRTLGVEMVEKVGTPFKIIKRGKNNWFQGIFGEKVSGDRRGIIPGSGRSVLIETKTIMDRNLQWSDFKVHQPERLSQHAELGGWSLLVWVHNSGIFIIEWPISDFHHGKSITPARAKKLDIRV